MASASGVAKGYFVEQAFGLLFFFVLSILFLFQLVMQRRAKYDERQLTQRQRVEDWKKVAAPAKRQHRQSSVSRMIDQHNASAPGSKRNSVDGAFSPTLKDHRSISMPSQDGGISAPETPHGAYSPRESSSVSNDTFSSNPSTDGTDSAEQAPPKSKQEAPQTRGSGTWNKQPQRGSLHYNVPIAEHPTAEREKRPRVGMVQIVLHRIGFAASVLKVIHFVDPHSALGVFPFSVTIQIAYMVNGLLFVCAIFAFLYPLHLIRVLSLNNRSRTIFFVGVTLSVLTIIVCFFVPIAYHFVGPLNYLRAIIFLWLMFATIAITVVLDIYSPRLIASLEKLITFHSKGPGKVARFQGTVSNNNLLSNASTNPSSPADSPVASPSHQSRSLIQADTVSDSTAPLALTRSASSSESVAQRHSLLPQSVQGPAVALVDPLGDSASATVESRLDINSSSAELAAEDNENYRSRGSDASPSGSPLPLIQHNAKSSSCDNLDNIRSEDSSPNQSAQNTPTMTFASLKTHVNVPPLSLSKLGRSAGEQKSNYSQPNHRHVQTSLVQYTVSEAVVSIHDPSIPSISEVAPPPASAPVSAANKGYKVGQRRSVSRSMSESRKRRAAKNPVIRQYKKLIERMRLFQICANVIMVLLLIGLLIGLTGQLKDPRAVAAAPSRSNFLEAITYTIYDVVLFLGLSLALWFAYIPGSCSQFGCSRLPTCLKALECLRKIRKAAPTQRDERRLSFHSVSPPPPGGRALGNESPAVQLAVQQ